MEDNSTSSIVRVTLEGKKLTCDIGFDEGRSFDPSNIGDLLVWFVQDQVLHLIPQAQQLFIARAKTIKEARDLETAVVQTPEGQVQQDGE